MENENKILAFWQWFVKSESIFNECIENEASENREYVVEQLNEQILGLGVFSWDIGLDDNDNWFLLISPNGNPDQFEVSQDIMELAPEHLDWLFYASKPAQDWNREFTVFDNYMNEEVIDASGWHCVILEDEDENLELILEAKNVAHLDLDIAEFAAEEFVIKEIGESARIQLISSIQIVTELDPDYASEKVSVLELREMLEEDL